MFPYKHSGSALTVPSKGIALLSLSLGSEPSGGRNHHLDSGHLTSEGKQQRTRELIIQTYVWSEKRKDINSHLENAAAKNEQLGFLQLLFPEVCRSITNILP